MTELEAIRQRIETELDRDRWHHDHVPAAEAREAILAALDGPLPDTLPEGDPA